MATNVAANTAAIALMPCAATGCRMTIVMPQITAMKVEESQLEMRVLREG